MTLQQNNQEVFSSPVKEFLNPSTKRNYNYKNQAQKTGYHPTRRGGYVKKPTWESHEPPTAFWVDPSGFVKKQGHVYSKLIVFMLYESLAGYRQVCITDKVLATVLETTPSYARKIRLKIIKHGLLTVIRPENRSSANTYMLYPALLYPNILNDLSILFGILNGDHISKVIHNEDTPTKLKVITREKCGEEFTLTTENPPEAQTDDGLQVAKAEVVLSALLYERETTQYCKNYLQIGVEIPTNDDKNYLDDGALASIFGSGEQTMDEKDISLLTGGQYPSKFPKKEGDSTRLSWQGIRNDSSSRRFFQAPGNSRGHSTHEPTVIRTDRPHLNGINRYQIWKEPEPIKRNTFEEMDKLDAASQTEASKKFSKLIGFDAMSAYMGRVVKNTMT